MPSEGGFFESSDPHDDVWHKLAKENLLSDFVLANLDATVNFSAIDADVYSVDTEDIGKGESAPAFKALEKAEKEKLNRFIKSQPPSGQVTSIVALLFSLIGKNTFYPIEDKDIKKYLTRIVEVMSAEQRAHCLELDYAYGKAIKDKIQGLANEFAAIEFNNWLTTQKVKLQPSFVLPASIAPSDNGPAITKSLYVTERGMNGLEAAVIGKVAQLENVEWWHCNFERSKGVYINGNVHHYRDFIVLTASKNIVVIETKGDDRDNSNSKDKLKLGEIWASQANQITQHLSVQMLFFCVFLPKNVNKLRYSFKYKK